MGNPIRDRISGLRAEAKRHREISGRLRRERARLARVPMAQRDGLARLRLLVAAQERTRAAESCEREAKRLRAQLGRTWQ